MHTFSMNGHQSSWYLIDYTTDIDLRSQTSYKMNRSMYWPCQLWSSSWGPRHPMQPLHVLALSALEPQLRSQTSYKMNRSMYWPCQLWSSSWGPRHPMQPLHVLALSVLELQLRSQTSYATAPCIGLVSPGAPVEIPDILCNHSMYWPCQTWSSSWDPRHPM